MTGPRVVRVSGALAEVEPLADASLYELVRVGERRLFGEVVRIDGERGTVQVYEETGGLRVGAPVEPSGDALTIELGPGLLGSVLDGVGRPLAEVARALGDLITPGAEAATLDGAREWRFEAGRAPGETVHEGDVLGTVEERPGFVHRILVPPGVSGRIRTLASGVFTVRAPIGTLEDGTTLRLAHRWPVRRPRPVARRTPLGPPFVTGQRVFDLLFPVAEGGNVAVPGGFGTGKTVIEQSLAKYAAADVVVYVGCGERGNEMAEVLSEFPVLTDRRTGRAVMDRTVLLVNTSNMPVAAREASIHVGVTIAEYYRDQGYRVALMADSHSRWAEALREIGARLQEMPGEEGYPTYLGDRIGKFYERAGPVVAAGSPERSGNLTIISAISPPGGDLSEPVTQASLRVVGALWALDAGLAQQRQFPAVDWETSYTLYAELTAEWFAREVGERWPELRRETLALLQADHELREIVALVGADALQDADRLTLEVARIIRESVLGQSAYDPHDAWSPVEKTCLLATLALDLRAAGRAALERGVAYDRIDLTPVAALLSELRRTPAAELEARAAQVRAAIEGVAR
ncbi:MAG TPA: V-type ATP synthase subunit A [Gemmatimonadales bacterium]|nr:V-type ATP synthase subunit A [Gemmatimonadales bacterium]